MKYQAVVDTSYFYYHENGINFVMSNGDVVIMKIYDEPVNGKYMDNCWLTVSE